MPNVGAKTAQAQRPRILLLDDDADLRRTLEDILTLKNYECLSAARGEQALQIVASQDVDVAILDIRLEDMDGLDVLQGIRRRSSTTECILLTGHATQDLAIEAVNRGAYSFLQKPLEMDQLLLFIRNAVEKQRMERALRCSEQRYRTLFDYASDAIFVHDVDGKFLDVNQIACDQLAYGRETLMRLMFGDIISPEECRQMSARLEELQDTGHIIFNTALIRSDGSDFPVEISSRLIEYGHSPAILSIARDITVRIKSQRALQKAHDQQAALYAVTAAASKFLDPQELLPKVLDVVIDIPSINADSGWIVLPGEMTGEELSIGAVRNMPEDCLNAETVDALSRCQFHTALLDGKDPPPEPVLLKNCPAIPSDVLTKVDLDSVISFPLKVSERVLGILNLGWRQPHPFTEEDQELLMSIGRQVGLALRNAQLYQTALQVDRLRTINAIAAAASSSLELDVVLRNVIEMTCEAIKARDGAILEIELETGDLVFMSASHEDLLGQRIPAGKSVAGWVAENRQVTYANDVSADSRWYAGFDNSVDLDIDSLLCAPLIFHDQLIGVIEIINKRQGCFSEEDANLLEAVASIASVALENARLYTSTRDRAEELLLLNEIGLALTRTLDYNALVDNALARVQRLFQAEHVSLLQPDPYTGELVFIKALTGKDPIDIDVCLEPGEGFAGWALEHRQAVLVDNARNDQRFSTRVDKQTGMQTCSLMAVPLLTAESEIGVIEVVSERAAAYTNEDLRTLQSLASTLAVALDNARLYNDLKELLLERERAQAHLIQSEKMAALGRLAASVAHEINNPLQAIQGCLTLFGEEMAGAQRQDKMRRYLETVNEEIGRIAVIVRRMRDFYRPAEEGYHPTDVAEVFESVLGLAAKQLQHSHVSVETTWNGNSPIIEANPGHLKQVFLNLVLNAIDAMPEGGKLSVAVTPDSLQRNHEQIARRAVKIEVSDTGKGMSPETIDQIYEPFFTTKAKGTGLGLYISYGIIQSLHGTIDVASQLDHGTTFTIRLPVEQP